MIQPSDKFQFCIGVSSILVSAGVSISLITGSVVNFSVAGAKLSVNQKLEKVERITKALEASTQELKQEPSVSRIKIKAIENDLRRVDRQIQTEESAIADELDRFVDNDI